MSDSCCSNTEKKIPRIRSLPKNYRCGLEVPVFDTLYDTLDSIYRQGAPCVQMYLTNKTGSRVHEFTPEDLAKTKEFCLNKDINFYIHCPLIANLAGDLYKGMRTVIQKELDIIKDLPGSCVLHVGKALNLGESKGLENVANRINELDFRTGQHPRNRYPLLLECAAGQGTELGKTWDELRKLYEGLDKTKVGLCLDTQHIFASGMNKLESEEDIVKLFDETEAVMGRKPSLFHVNDSKKLFDSRVDRHEDIGKGYIWYKNNDSLVALIKRCNEDSIDMILETHNSIADLRTMNALTDKLKN